MKLLITGSGGMLGAEIAAAAMAAGHEVIRSRRRASPGFLSADLVLPEGFANLADAEWDEVIHCAAWRDPETCERDPDGAEAINVTATQRLAELAAARRARMLFISTDLVFPGTEAPYAEDAVSRPLSRYGDTKRRGELAVLAASPENVVMRVPLLYGLAAGIGQCPFLLSTLRALTSSTPWPMDDAIVKCPTWTGDVAAAILFLLERGEGGIFHCRAPDRRTRYALTAMVADVLGLSMASVIRREASPGGDAMRPRDAFLGMDRLLALGFSEPLPLPERLGRLKPAILQAMGRLDCRQE
jgi:dTDP-4-dehydrorhamnose reductase